MWSPTLLFWGDGDLQPGHIQPPSNRQVTQKPKHLLGEGSTSEGQYSISGLASKGAAAQGAPLICKEPGIHFRKALASLFSKPFSCRHGLRFRSAWDWQCCVIARSAPSPQPQTPRRWQTHETHQRCEYSSCHALFHCCFFLFFLLIEKEKTEKSYKSTKRQQYWQDIPVPHSHPGEGSLPHPQAGRNTSLGPSTSAALADQSLGVRGHAGAAAPAICTGNVPLQTGTPGYGCPFS